jgi:hypothetical protein
MVLPYLKGFLYFFVHVMVNGLWFILGIIEVYLQIWFRYLTDSSPHSGNTHRDRGRGGKTGTYTFRGGNSAQETKDDSEQGTTEKRADIQDRHPDGE